MFAQQHNEGICSRQVARQYERCRVQTSGVGPDLSDSFSAHRAGLTRRLNDESDPYYLGDAAGEVLEAEIEDRLLHGREWG